MGVQFRLPGTLTMSGITVAMPEPRSTILPQNVAFGVLNPTTWADMVMTVRKAAADISNNIEWLNYVQSAGLTSSIVSSSSNPFGRGIDWDNAIASTNYVPGGGSIIQLPSINSGGGVQHSTTTNITSNNSGVSSDGTLILPDKQNYSALFSKRLELIEEYCKKYGKMVDVEAIRSKYGDDPKSGVEYCDEILNEKFNQTFLRKIVHKKYDDYNKSRQNSAKEIADDWVDAVLSAGLGALNISSGGVSKDNILDVIGAFALNKEVKNGKVSLENVFESPDMTLDLIETLKARADKSLLDKNVSDEKKERILAKIETLRVNYDKYADSIADEDKHNDIEFKAVRKQLAKTYIELFAILRLDEAKKNDKVAPQFYGLPEDSEITFNDQTQRAKNEIIAYKNRNQLKITI